MMEQSKQCPKCGDTAWWNNYCGAYVCGGCDHHLGLARCYCGWAEDGGNGKEQLEELGETIEPEEY